jgi:hypothetical protein
MLYIRLGYSISLFSLANNARPLLGMQCHSRCLNCAQGTELFLLFSSFLGRFRPIFQITLPINDSAIEQLHPQKPII